MGERLEDDVAMAGAVSLPSQRRQAERMAGVVGQVESTLKGKGGDLAISQPGKPGPNQSIEFLLVKGLTLEWSIGAA